MNDLVGRTLGQCRIVEQLGKGGMATVFKAFQPSLERYVAVKVLLPYFAHEEGFSERFAREARAIARLDHPHILPIYDYGREGDVHYIVMRYVDAGTLKDLEAGGPIPLDRTAEIVAQIADALDYAHQRGVIHRDVKPANVLMDRGEWVLLTDFGLAKMVEGSQQLTASGVGVGTPAYMPPEQGQGRSIDARADVYSLGILLYEMLTGRVPYEAETPLAVVLKHVTEPLPLPRAMNPEIPETVELVILKSLAKAPEDRYQSAGEMAVALCQAIQDAKMLSEACPLPGEALPSLATAKAPAQVAQPAKPEAVPEASPEAVKAAPAPVIEPVVGKPAVPSARRVPWWVYWVGTIVILALIAGGVWWVAEGRSRLLARIPTPTMSADQRPLPTYTSVRPTLAPIEPGISLRVGLTGEPGTAAEVNAERLARYLGDRMGIEVRVVVVEGRTMLPGLMHERQVDAIFVPVSEYLWLRDDQDVPIVPLLYAGPVFSAVVVVRADSDIQNVEHLRGQPVALVSWDAGAGILGRAALIERGLDVDQECEAIYLTPSFDIEAGVEALAMVNDGRVVAAIVDHLALDRVEERLPEAHGKLRVLAESPPSCIGVVAAWPDLPSEQVSALRDALVEADPELLRALMPHSGLLFVDEPLAENMASALRALGLGAWQLVEGIPPKPWSPPELPPPAQSREIRIGMVPAAGITVEGHRYGTPIYKSLQKAGRDFDLELEVKETPGDGQPVDAALDLIGQGYNVLVTVGWQDPRALWALARDHPEIKFIHFGHRYEELLPNLMSFTYRMHEAGFLAGALAGKASQGRRVGVIGGLLVPAFEQLAAGFENGVKYACPECEAMVKLTDSFTDLELGQEVGRQAVEEGADVVFHAASACGSAAILSAAREGAWVIGADWDEYRSTFKEGDALNADHLLGSVAIRADDQIYDAIKRLVYDDFEPGSFVLGFAEGGFEFLASPESAHPQWPELGEYLEAIIEGLRSGEIRP